MNLKRYISASSIIVSNIAKNLVMASRTTQRLRSRKTRTYRGGNNNETLKRFFDQRWGFLASNVNISHLKNQTIMEVGPGDHIALALPLFSHGAAQYIARDRFLGPVLDEEKFSLYEDSIQALREVHAVDHHSLEEFSSNWRELIEKKATLLRTALEIPSSQIANSVDLSFSFNVLEHVYNIEDSARSLFDSAKPGGLSVHRVDYSDHGIMGTENPFLWLCIPSKVYQLMASNRGLANRVRHHQVVDGFQQAGFQVEATVIEEFEPQSLADLSSVLPREYLEMPRESLLAKTAIIKARKPS